MLKLEGRRGDRKGLVSSESWFVGLVGPERTRVIPSVSAKKAKWPAYQHEVSRYRGVGICWSACAATTVLEAT